MGESYRIGRSSRCAFVVTDLSVSRHHAEVTVNGKGVLVKDLGSRNGTFVDGFRITAAEVQAGQSVRFGNTQFQLVFLEPAGAEHENSELSTYVANVPPQPASLHQLSITQKRVLAVLLEGKSEKAVAAKLKISWQTVHVHVKEIYKKVGVNSRPELLALFVAESKKPGK